MVDVDRLLAALAAEERRGVCRYLLSREDPVTIEELATVLGAPSGEPDRPSTIDEGSFDSLIALLHHNHLPRLDEADLVEYDPGQSVVVAGPALPTAKPVLDALNEMEVSRSRP